MKKRIIGAIATLTLVGTTITTGFAATSETEVGSLRLSWGHHYSEASATAIPKEEAQQIGLNALAEFFGTNLSQLGDYVIEMTYNPAVNVRESVISEPMYDIDGRLVTIDDIPDYAFPMSVTRSLWHGTIIIPNDRTPCPEGFMLRSSDLFRFRVDSLTGELVNLQFFPSEDPIARPTMPSECMGSPIQVFEYRDNMTAQHNIEFASHAMRFAEETGIFEAQALRAAINGSGWMMGRDNSFELVVSVAVESVDGETVELRFQGRNRKELIDVEFFSRTVDHFVDRDGNIVQPASLFAGNPTITNWIYR